MESLNEKKKTGISLKISVFMMLLIILTGAASLASAWGGKLGDNLEYDLDVGILY
ncbi:MAG: hypothetical protein II888_02475 [Clostridia bacterium]|nr:hypothetical protein [Clostridia bacterium]